MKITDPEVIKSGEQDLIQSVQEDLNTEAVREILKERLSVAALSSKGGQIVVHNNEIAFRLDFEISLSGSLLFDREGNFIEDGQESAAVPFAGPMTDEIIEDRITEDDPDDEDQEFGLEDDEQDMDEEDLSIDLPDYDLEDDEEEEVELSMPDDEDEDLDLAAEELALEALEEDPSSLLSDKDTEEDMLAPDDGLDQDENPFEDDDAQDLDDDINDILKESREFWEQKKDS